MRVAAGLVGLLRVDDGLPLAVLLEDPGLVRVRLPGVEVPAAGVGLGLLVPLAGRVVLDLLEVLRLADGHVEAEFVLVVQWHLALVGRAYGGHGVRSLVPSDLELAAHVAVVVALVDETVVVDGVVDAVGGDLVLERHLVAALAGAVGDDGAVGHAVGRDAVVDGLGRRGRRFGAHAPGLGRILVGRVDGRVHPALLGGLDVDPVLSFLPVAQVEVGGRGEVVELGVAAVGEGDRLADRLGRDVAVLLTLIVDDGGAVQGLSDAAAVAARMQGIADRGGGADLQVGPLLVRGGDRQIVVRRCGLVFVEHDHDDAAGRVDMAFHDLVDAVRRIVIERGGRLVGVGTGVFISVWRDGLVPVVLPHLRVVDAGPVPHAGGGPVAGRRAHGHDAAVAVALARMPLAEAGHAFRVRVAQRLGGLAGRIVHAHADRGHGAAHAVQVRRGTPRPRRVVLVGPELRGRTATARASLVSAAATGVGGARGQTAGQRRRGGEQGQRLPSVTVLGTQCSVSFQRFICRCSPHPWWDRSGKLIPSEHFTCPAVDKRRYRIRFRHPPAMQPRFRACRVGHFPGRHGYEKGTPKGP